MKQLLIDLDICEKCETCDMHCTYFQHPRNNGVESLREFAHFSVMCRRCDDAPCVASCPWEALEMQATHMLKRYMMRCTSCKSCSRACPFGVIYPETIPFIIARCDHCLGRIGDDTPVCASGCTRGGLRYGEFGENKEDGIYRASEYLFVKTRYKWERREPPPVKKK